MSDDEIYLFENIREVIDANRSFELKHVAVPNGKERLEIEFEQEKIVLTEQCPKSDLWFVQAIEETMAEANGTKCGLSIWMEPEETKDFHSFSFESPDWPTQRELTYNWSHSGGSERGYLSRHGTCRRTEID